MADESTGTGAPPLTEGVQRYAATLLKGLRYRGELLSVEWQEEKRRLFQVVLSAVFAALSATLALASVNVLLLLVFWDTYRVEVTVAFAVLYAVLALVLALIVRRRVRLAEKPFQATFEELRRDGERFVPRGGE